MKLWDKGFSVDKKIEDFTVGQDREMDLYLAPFDVLGTMAHITMLESVGLLDKSELPVLLKTLKEIYETAQKGEFVIEPQFDYAHKSGYGYQPEYESLYAHWLIPYSKALDNNLSPVKIEDHGDS